MQKRALASLFAAAMLAVAGCGSSSSPPAPTVTPPSPTPPPPPPPPPETSTVRIVHASADAPNVDILVDGDVTFANVPFLAATELVELDSGDYEIQVNAILPGDGRLPVIGGPDDPVVLTLEADTQYNVLAIGDVAAAADSGVAFGPLVLTQPQIEIPAGNLRVRVVHAAPGAPEVEVFATAPGDLPPGAPSLGSFVFGEALEPLEIGAGDYQIRVALPGGETVVFDSGALPLPEGADLLIAAVTNTGAGDSPIKLLVSDGESAFTLLDVNTTANVRVVHASPDAPNVDVFANDVALLTDVPFPLASPFLPVPAGEYDVRVTEAGNPGFIALDAELTFEAGSETTVIATGLVGAADNEPEAFGALVLADDRRRIATEAKVRIVHGAPTAGLVDVYVLAPGTALADAEPALAEFAFREDTGYLSLPGGDYEITVTAANDATLVAIGPLVITIDEGGVYKAIARDPLPGSTEFGLILLDDLAP